MTTDDFLAHFHGVRPTDDFLAHFHGVRPTGADAWTAHCPLHDDQHASLSIAEQGSRRLLHCHVCGRDRVGRVLLAAGLEVSDLFCEDAPAKVPAPRRDGVIPISNRALDEAIRQRVTGRPESMISLPPAPVVEHWQAQLAGPVAERLLEVKGWSLPTLQRLGVGWDGGRVTFPVRDGEDRLTGLVRYLPGGVKPKTLAVGPRDLFPAPESLGGDVWLLEGEPDAVTGHELGLDAVSVPGVATWKPTFPERLQGKRVTVCMDADREGRQCAQDRVGQLRGVGVAAVTVDLAPARSDGTDLGDLLVGALAEGRVGALRAYLRRLADEAWADAAKAAA